MPPWRRNFRGRIVRIGAVCAAAVLAGAPALANDSVAGLALGGLELLRTAAVEMVEEELYISPDEVRVRYVFRNVSGKPFDTLVAFPLPPVGFPYEMIWVPVPIETDANYVGFETWVDGTPVPLQVESRARVMGLDRTDALLAAGLPLVPFDLGITDQIAALPATTRAELQAQHLIDAEGAPLWTLGTTLWRQQTFPVGRDVVVEHRYRPVRGGSAMAPVGNFDGVLEPDHWAYDYAQEARSQYCVEPEMEGELSYRRTNGVGLEARHFASSDVGYVLRTGANWAGPIGRFRLVVEVPNEFDAAFVCFDGARRVAPNRIEADLTDYWPDQDLAVLFVHLHGEGIARDE